MKGRVHFALFLSRCFSSQTVVGASFLVGVALMPGVAVSRETAASEHRQQQDIAALVRELDYLIEHTERLAVRYSQTK